MKSKFRTILMVLAVATLAMPIASQAGCHKSSCGGTGMIFNETDGMYYPLPGTKSKTIYRAVDYKYIPVATYKGCAKSVHVRCEQRGGWWWNTTWMSPSMECYYVR